MITLTECVEQNVCASYFFNNYFKIFNIANTMLIIEWYYEITIVVILKILTEREISCQELYPRD